MPRRGPADEATRKRLEEARLKGLETRRMRGALKKVEKEESKEALRKAYEEKVLKKQSQPQQETTKDIKVEETDKEIYPKARVADETDGEDSDAEELPPPPPKTSKKKVSKSPKVTSDEGIVTPSQNYKQMYYAAKLQRLQQEQEQSNFMSSYASMPSAVHAADIARQQLKSKVNREVYDRVYKDLFGV